MISKKKVEGEMNGSSSHQQGVQQVYQHSPMPQQQQQYQQQQQQQQQVSNLAQKVIDPSQSGNLQHQQHLQQHQQNRQNMKSNSLSMSVIVSPNSNSYQIPNLHSNQCVQSPSNSNPSVAAFSSTNSQQKSSPQQIQQLNNKALQLIKNNYFKPNASGLSQASASLNQQQYLSSPTGQINSPNTNQQGQQQILLNSSQTSGVNAVSNKKSPKISNHSHQNNNNNNAKCSSSGLNVNINQKENNQSNKEQIAESIPNIGLAYATSSTNQKSHSNLPQSIDKTTHLQNLDKIRSNLNSKLQIQTDLNSMVVGGNSLSNLGLICNQGAIGNIYLNLPSSTTHGSTQINGNQSNLLSNQNQTFKKILSITPQYASSSKIKMFESQNKQLNDLALKNKKEGNISNSVQQVSAASSMQILSSVPVKVSQNKIDIDDDNDEIYRNEGQQDQQDEESDNFNANNAEKTNQNQEINNIIGNSSVNLEYSKNSQHKQSDLDNLNLAAALMFDKLKKRDKNPNSAKGHPRNAYQSGLNSNASYSKSSLPSNNSTTVNHCQGNNSNNNQNQQNQSLNKNGLIPSQTATPSNQQPATFLSNSINNTANKNIFGFTSNNVTSNNSNLNPQSSKNQLSKTLSFTLQQYNQLMNHDLHQLQQHQQQSQNIMKQIHSQTTNQQNELYNQQNINYNLNLPQVNSSTNIVNNQLNPNINAQTIKSPSQQLHTTQKHRKVVSMSSSSPKYSKENMYIDCSKGSYNIVDVKKLFKGTSQSTATNFQLHSTNQVNSNKQSKQLGSGEKGEAIICTPHNHPNQSAQQGDNKTNVLQIKFSKTPGNMSFNHSANNNNNNVQNNENSREVEKQNNKNQEKSKNFLSKITNQGKNQFPVENTSSKKQHQKKAHKSQSCISVQTTNQNQQKVTGINNVHNLKDDAKKVPQISIQQPSHDSLYNKNKFIYQSQTDFSLLKQQLMEQQHLIDQMNDKQSHNYQQHHISCDETTAVNSNAKEKIPDHVQLHQFSQEQYLKQENDRITIKFDQILKQRIDENSYSEIMDAFAQLASSDIFFSSSLQKFKICLDSLMHDMNAKIKNLKIFAAKTQQLKKSVESINNEKRQLQNKVNILQNENQQLLSNSTNVTNSNQSKTNNNINMPSDCCNNTNFNRPQNFTLAQAPTNLNDYGNQIQEETQQFKKLSAKYNSTGNQKDVSHFQEKQTQTAVKEFDSTEKQKQEQVNNLQIQKEEVDEVVNENQILRSYIVEQEKKLTAYKDKESSMIKLLLAIKKNGVDIDEIYEKDVVNQVNTNKNQQKNNNNNNNDDDDDDQDDTDENYDSNNQLRSRYIENIKNGRVDERNNSQSQGFADESIINDSDESSFNYFGKPQSLNDSMFSEIDEPKGVSNLNSGRSKIEDGIKKKLRLNLNDLKKVTTQPNEEVAQNNINNEVVQQQQIKQQNQQLNDLHQHQSPKQMQNLIHDEQNVNHNQFMSNHKGFKNQNILIEQEYQECNFDKNQNKKLISPSQQMTADCQDQYEECNNEQYQQQSDNQYLLLQEYAFNAQMKPNAYKDLNDYIQQSDYQTHKVDSQMQNFDGEEDQLQDNREREDSSVIINNNQFDSQNELIKKLDDISLTWPDDNKPIVF